MNWRKLYSLFQYYLLNWPAGILVFMNCASATIGLLYVQTQVDIGTQYLPAVASIGYFLSRALYAIDHGLSISRNEVLAYLFAVSTAFSVAMQWNLGIDAVGRDKQSSLDYTVAMYAFSMTFYFAGAACNRIRYKKSDVIAICLSLLVVIPYMAAPRNGLFFDYWLLRVATGMEKFTHLTISEWCVFLFIGSFAFASDKLKPIVIIASVVCLFGMQGRSSTVFTLFTLLVFWFLTGNKRKYFIYIGTAAVLVVGLFMFTPLIEFLVDSSDRAMDRMLLDSEDDSLVGRQNILLDSMQYLPKMIMYGDPSYIALEAGSMGSYIHNILSMWQFFGLLPFILIIVMLVRSLLVMRSRLTTGELSVMEEIGCMVLIYVVVSVIFAKSVNFYWLWFAVGYWMLQYAVPEAALVDRSRKKKRKKQRKRKRGGSLPSGKFRF